MKTLKKRASKVAHNQPKPFFSQSSPVHSPKLIFRIINMSQDTSVSLSVNFPDPHAHRIDERKTRSESETTKCSFYLNVLWLLLSFQLFFSSF